MNETTEKLIRELAEKFGTTAEHLWGVMVAQAPIEALSVLGSFIGIMATIGVLFWRAGYMKREGIEKKDNDQTEIGFDLQVLLGAATLFAVVIFAVDGLPTIWTGLFNPEYWALKQLLP